MLQNDGGPGQRTSADRHLGSGFTGHVVVSGGGKVCWLSLPKGSSQIVAVVVVGQDSR